MRRREIVGLHVDQPEEIRLKEMEPCPTQHLYRIRVTEVMTDLSERLEVVIRDLRSVVHCPWCGSRRGGSYENPHRVLRSRSSGSISGKMSNVQETPLRNV